MTVISRDSIGRVSAFVYAVCVLCIVLLGAFCTASCKNTETDETTSDVPKKLVVVEHAPVGLIRNSFSLAGELTPIIDVTLSAQVAGQVMQVPVNEGDMVNNGQVLAIIDDRELRARYNQLTAQMIAQQATIAKLKQLARPQEIALLEAQVESARVALENAKKSLERANSLFDAGVISLSEVEKARMAKESAQAAYTAASENLDLAREGAREEDIVAAEAALKSLEAQLDQVTIQIDKSQIKAPVDGVISKVYAEPSESVSPGIPVIDMVNLSQMLIKVGLAESDLIMVKQGSTVVVRLNLAPDQPLPGLVTSISPKVDPVTGTFAIEITVPNPGGQILGGFYAEVEFTRAIVENAVIAPIDALITEGEKWYAFVVNAGMAEKREVLPGILTATHAQIIEGVSKDELLVVVGQRLLTDGDLVEVSETVEPSLPAENEILAEMQKKMAESSLEKETGANKPENGEEDAETKAEEKADGDV